MLNTRKEIAIVVQRYGLEVNGGAEAHAMKLAEKLQINHNVHVLTSCAKEYRYRFENDYPANTSTINNVKVTRFSISYYRKPEKDFAELDDKVLKNSASDIEIRQWLKEIGPYSEDLINFVKRNKSNYDWFIFFTYLYSTTTLVLNLVKDKSILVPTAHDEKPIWCRFFKQFFSYPKFISFNSESEKRLLNKITNDQIPSNDIIGIGLDLPSSRIYSNDNYFLYIGRVQKEKNCHLLIKYYLSLPDKIKKTHPLVIVGKVNMDVPEDDNISYLGFVSDTKKYELLSRCKLLINPSVYESLSMVVLEAWFYKKPVFVNKNSDVLYNHIKESKGGLYFDSEESFIHGIKEFLKPENSNLIESYGINGNRYSQKYNWKNVLKKYNNMFNTFNNRTIPKVAFVVQRAGENITGGAEYHCLQVAQKLSKFWDIEIITTCALDYVTWQNYYPPGDENFGNIKINRFQVDNERDIRLFNEFSEQLNKLDYIDDETANNWMMKQGPYSTSMQSYITRNKNNFDAFIFYTYLYAHTWFSLRDVQEKSILVPLAHDEWTIHLNFWDKFFSMARNLIFMTDSEKNFLRKRFNNLNLSGPTVGFAIDKPFSLSPLSFRNNYNIDDNFVLYLGRVDPSKGCESLFENFLKINCGRNINPSKLVVIGNAFMDVPKHPDIINLGQVDEQTKWNALAACQFLIMPSENESLSIVLLEAWSVSKPVLVNGNCQVLVDQCMKSNGGLWYTNDEEYEKCSRLLTEGQYANALGKSGNEFVEKNYSWKMIEKKFRKVVEEMLV